MPELSKVNLGFAEVNGKAIDQTSGVSFWEFQVDSDGRYSSLAGALTKSCNQALAADLGKGNFNFRSFDGSNEFLL